MFIFLLEDNVSLDAVFILVMLKVYVLVNIICSSCCGFPFLFKKKCIWGELN